MKWWNWQAIFARAAASLQRSGELPLALLCQTIADEIAREFKED